jgi:hypothetical protein
MSTRKVRASEADAKIKVLKKRLIEMNNDLKTVHPLYKISKSGRRESILIQSIDSIKKEIKLVSDIKKKNESEKQHKNAS